MNYKNKIIICFLILVVLVGCKSKSYNKDSIKKKDLAPKSLNELNKEIDLIMDNVGKLEKINLGIDVDDKDKTDKNEDQSEKEDESDKADEDKKSDTASQNVEKNSEENKEKTDEVTKEEEKDKKIEKTWKEIDKSLEKLYSLWNEYGVKANKKGAKSEDMDEVEDSLNKLTKAVEDKEILTVYNYGSKTLKLLDPFYSLYRDEINGEVSKLKYMIYQYHINGIKGSKNTALLFISDSEDEINKIRLKWKDKKDKDEKIEKISFGFKNLPEALDENSRKLLILKKDTLIKNINDLEN
ncbi:MAG: hypothetical protein ACTHW2_01420 [Tissierella sp.]|uniref:hypothetical protein n=1 Tax=Tissierella sp. TaxID=41274 RepID=UPI003F971819